MPLSATHFYYRAGFGPHASQLAQPTSFDARTAFEQCWQASAAAPQPIMVSQNAVDGLINGLGNLGRLQQAAGEEQIDMRQELARRNREGVRSLNLLWLEEMVQSPAQLREKMALFWHGHFACRNLNSFYQQQLLQVIREHALGNFGTLLKAVSQSPAMLAFLNNQQNRKQQPNENFAREVMELFTMGRGHYTESDVREAARAFTGWGFTPDGQFVFRRQQHDFGTKTVLGHAGAWDGNDVLRLLLEQRATARFVVRKIYRYLVHDQPDEEKVEWLASRFFSNGYEIGPLLRDIFTSNWFYSRENMGSLIKSPVELWVGIRRLLPMQLDNPAIQLLLQRALGQVLFYPPTVAGWPGGTAWIDSSSLLLRMRLAHLVAMADPLELSIRADDDVNMGRMSNMEMEGMPQRFRLKASIDWAPLYKAWQNIPQQQLYKTITDALLVAGPPPVLKTAAVQPSVGAEEAIRSLVIGTLSSPEFQIS